MQEFTLKTIVNGIGPLPDKYTAYLFSTQGNIVIPIRLDQISVENILLTQQNIPQARPTIYDTVDRCLKACGLKICCLYIYLYLDGIFYSYLRIFQNGKTIDVDIKLSDGLCTAIKSRVPIMVDEKISLKFSLEKAPLHKYF